MPQTGILDFTVEYLISGVVQNTDYFSITFEQNPPPPTSSSLWSSNGSIAYYNAGNIGIGTDTPGTYRLAVNGNIRAKEIKVETANWPDYVFESDYQLPSLKNVKSFIEMNGHLPNIPSAFEVKTSGVELGEMNRLLLEKIEQLTLYTINLEEALQNQSKASKEYLEKLEQLERFVKNQLKE